MPLTQFKCAAGTVPVVECLKKCPIGSRCLSLPTLTEVGKLRNLDKLSVTQLLNPTRIEYLKMEYDYAVDPKDRAFLFLGTRHHQKLEAVAQKLKVVSESRMVSEDVTGQADLLEPIDGTDTYRLVDYKTWGGFAVRKALGSQYKEPDLESTALQVNNYRIMFEDVGFKVAEMFVQVAVRDFTAQTAKQYDLSEKMFLITIPLMPDAEVKDYFSRKAESLLYALQHKELPAMCDYEDRWGGRRCKSYCEVFMYCPEGCKINKVEAK